MDALAAALLDLVNFLNSPKRDGVLLKEAGVELDRALFPLLVRIGDSGTIGVAELAGQVGRDHTTVSRQLGKLEGLALIERAEEGSDRRRRAVRLRDGGIAMVSAIVAARRRALSAALSGWKDAELACLTELAQRFADDLKLFSNEREKKADHSGIIDPK